MKRLLALALVLVLALSLIPAFALQASAEEYASPTPTGGEEKPKPKPVAPPKKELIYNYYNPVPYVLNVSEGEEGVLVSAAAHAGGETDADGAQLYAPDNWLMGLMLDKMADVDADRREAVFTLNSSLIPTKARSLALYEGGEAGEPESRVRVKLGSFEGAQLPENSFIRLELPGKTLVTLPASALSGGALELAVSYYADRVAVELLRDGAATEDVGAYVALPAAGAQFGSIVDGEALELPGSGRTVDGEDYFVSALADISNGVIIRLS